MSRQPSGTQAVDRAALLISTIVSAEDPISFAGIVEASELPKSTASRLLTALERTDLIQRDDEGGYLAGPLFWGFAARRDSYSQLVQLAQPTLEDIAGTTRETVNLGIPRGGRVEHVAQIDTQYILGTRDWTTLQVPEHASAFGKVLYAFGDLPHPSGRLESFTERTLVTSQQLTSALDQVRDQGYATAVDELEVGLTAIAAPIPSPDPDAPACAAIGISGPTSRLEGHLADWGSLLQDHADSLSRQLPRNAPRGADKEGAA